MYLANWSDNDGNLKNMNTKEALETVAADWCEDTDITMALLEECDTDFKDKGLAPKKPRGGKGKSYRGVKSRAGLQCMLRSYETHIV